MNFTRIVERIDLGFTNTGRFPYALTVLSCGHMVNVELRDTLGTCDDCGARTRHAQGQSFKRCDCGCFVTTNIDSPNPHVEADRITKIGDQHECIACAREVERIDWLEHLPAGLVHHVRPRHGSYHLYRHDPKSPSGFFLIGSMPICPAVERALDAKRMATISPTEPA